MISSSGFDGHGVQLLTAKVAVAFAGYGARECFVIPAIT
jgi:hypothetical protein